MLNKMWSECHKDHKTNFTKSVELKTQESITMTKKVFLKLQTGATQDPMCEELSIFNK